MIRNQQYQEADYTYVIIPSNLSNEVMTNIYKHIMVTDDEELAKTIAHTQNSNYVSCKKVDTSPYLYKAKTIQVTLTKNLDTWSKQELCISTGYYLLSDIQKWHIETIEDLDTIKQNRACSAYVFTFTALVDFHDSQLQNYSDVNYQKLIDETLEFLNDTKSVKLYNAFNMIASLFKDNLTNTWRYSYKYISEQEKSSEEVSSSILSLVNALDIVRFGKDNLYNIPVLVRPDLYSINTDLDFYQRYSFVEGLLKEVVEYLNMCSVEQYVLYFYKEGKSWRYFIESYDEISYDEKRANILNEESLKSLKVLRDTDIKDFNICFYKLKNALVDEVNIFSLIDDQLETINNQIYKFKVLTKSRKTFHRDNNFISTKSLLEFTDSDDYIISLEDIKKSYFKQKELFEADLVSYFDYYTFSEEDNKTIRMLFPEYLDIHYLFLNKL